MLIKATEIQQMTKNLLVTQNMTQHQQYVEDSTTVHS